MFKKLKKLLSVLICASFLMVLFFGNAETTKAATADTYMLKVNRKLNVVTAYELNGKEYVPIRAMLCSCGSDTPLGVKHLGEKYRWRLMFGGTYSQYATRVFEHILFHSVPYWTKDPSNVEQGEYDRLGEKRSMGCIRLCVADARWIYMNCPSGTTVVFYDDANDPGPLGKPDNVKRVLGGGWDPTDEWSYGNPYNNLAPTMTIDGPLTVEAHRGAYNLLKGVKAYGSSKKNETDNVEITGDIDFYTPGKYKLTYTLVDSIGKKVSKTRTVKVVEAD